MACSSDESTHLYMERGRRLSPPTPTRKMKDLQIKKPLVELDIDKVGITNLKLPLKIRRGKNISNVTANVSVFVNLPKSKRGTHMSRMVRILTEATSELIDYNKIEELLKILKGKLDATYSYLMIKFTLFNLKEAPITKNKGFLDYNCFIEAVQNSKTQIRIGGDILITSLCPISKNVSINSAHSQRGEIKVNALLRDNKLWFDDLIKLVEKQGSCELFSVLKRTDEKFVTEEAYENAKIVEDIVRDVAYALKENKHIKEFSVSCENFESIHSHNAYSEITYKNGR